MTAFRQQASDSCWPEWNVHKEKEVWDSNFVSGGWIQASAGGFSISFKNCSCQTDQMLMLIVCASRQVLGFFYFFIIKLCSVKSLCHISVRWNRYFLYHVKYLEIFVYHFWCQEWPEKPIKNSKCGCACIPSDIYIESSRKTYWML